MTMTGTEIINLSAIFLGPFVAVIITLRHQDRKETKQSKLDIFHTLVGYRGQLTPIPRKFVFALNKIEVVFSKNDEIITLWKKYFEALNSQIGPHPEMNNFFADLLDAIAKECGYNHLRQTVYLKNYAPQQFQDELLRKNNFYDEATKFLKNSNNPKD